MTVSLAFSVTSGPAPDARIDDAVDDHAHVFDIFAVDPAAADDARLVRVIGSLSALAVLSLAASQRGEKTSWRPLIVATCFDALGHTRTAA